MGRIGSLGVASQWYEPMDLFRYSSPGVRDFNPDSQAYFSVNGSTLTLPFNVPYTDGEFDGSDFADWASSVNGDAFGDESATSTNTVSATDLAVMQVLGWTPAGVAPPTVELKASGLSYAGYNPATGQLTLTYDVQNTGSANAPSSTTGFYYYTGSSLFGNLYATQSIPGIAAGSTASELYTGSLPANIYNGNAPIQVVINYNDAVKEENTNGDPLPALTTLLFDTTSGYFDTLTGYCGQRRDDQYQS